MFLIISLAVATVPSALLYFQSPADFTPLHLTGKGELLLPGPFQDLVAAASLVCLVMGILATRLRLQPIPFALFTSLAPRLVALAVGDFVRSSGNPAAWEGANYLMPVIPLAAALLVMRPFERLSRDGASSAR